MPKFSNSGLQHGGVHTQFVGTIHAADSVTEMHH